MLLPAFAPKAIAALARYPDFELSDPAAVTWSGGQVRGPRKLPVTILRQGG